MRSIWQLDSFPLHSDIIVIGCGLTGLQSAINIKSAYPKLSVRIVEKGASPEGASVKNAGFACFGSVSELIDDIKNEGEERAYERVLKRYAGLKILLNQLKDENIGLSVKDGIEVFTSHEESLLDECESKLENINNNLKENLGFTPFSLRQNTFGINALDKAIAIRGEGVLDSGKVVKALIKIALDIGINIDYSQDIEQIEKNGETWTVNSKSNSFSALSVVVATNGFTKSLIPELPLVPGRGQILLTSSIPDLKIDRSFHLNQGYFYFRNYNGRVLLGGGRHLNRDIESTVSQDTTDFIQTKLEELLQQIILPGIPFTIENRWAGTMAFGPNNEKDPIVQEIKPGLVVAVRLGGMGVSMSSAVALEVKAMVCRHLNLST